MSDLASLRAKLAELNAEIRGYPQPIARCDAQLGGLFEERERVRRQLDALESARTGERAR